MPSEFLEKFETWSQPYFGDLYTNCEASENAVAQSLVMVAPIHGSTSVYETRTSPISDSLPSTKKACALIAQL